MPKFFYKVTNLMLFFVAILFLNGCVGHLIHAGMIAASDATIKAYGTRLKLIIYKEAATGHYKLETCKGDVIATALNYASARSSQAPMLAPKATLWFAPEMRKLNAEIASSCMQIRNPDGDLLKLGVRKKTGFKMPSLEAEVILKVEIPSLVRKIKGYPNFLKQRDVELKWLDSHPEIYKNNKCSRPGYASKPRDACQSKFEARQMYRNDCMPNIKCSVAEIEIGNFIENNSFVQNHSSDPSKLAEQVSFLYSKGCELNDEFADNGSIDIVRAFADLAVTATVENLVDSVLDLFEGENSDISRKYASAVISSLINYPICIEMRYFSCSRKYDIWVRDIERQFNICKSHKKNYDRLQSDIDYIGPRIKDLEKKVKELDDKYKKIRKNTSIELGCSNE